MYDYPESSEVGKLGTVRLDIESDEFWDPSALREEMLRQIEVCHGCRLCLSLCPDFPRLFHHIDDETDGDTTELTEGHLADFVDWVLPVQAVLSQVPLHTAACVHDRHPQATASGKGRARQAARRRNPAGSLPGQHRQQRPAAWQDGAAGQLGRNLQARPKPGRLVLEQAFGIHRDRILPKYHAQTFQAWFNSRQAAPDSQPRAAKAALFYTCPVNYNDPEVGQAVVKVLEHNDVEVTIVEEHCCGQPQIDGGELDKALANMRFNLGQIRRMVEQGYDILVLEPTCGMMIRKEYPSFFPDEMSDLSPRIFEVSEYLKWLNEKGQLKKDFKRDSGKVAYHRPCHLKYQAIGQQTLQLLRMISNDVLFVDKGCSGMDGTWGMKTEYFKASLHVARGLCQGMKDAQPATFVTDCGMSALQIQQGTGLQAVHPYQLLAEAYGL